jgi:hypothetical protein
MSKFSKEDEEKRTLRRKNDRIVLEGALQALIELDGSGHIVGEVIMALDKVLAPDEKLHLWIMLQQGILQDMKHAAQEKAEDEKRPD